MAQPTSFVLDPSVLAAFGLPTTASVHPFGSGHINRTFLVQSEETPKQWILQKINTYVFTKPWAIAQNLEEAADYLAEHHPDYLFIRPIPTVGGQWLHEVADEHWRLTPFIPNSYSVNEATDPTQAYEAARQFGRLARYLDGMDLHRCTPTIPDFHNLRWRYTQFEQALAAAPAERLEVAEALIELFMKHQDLVATYDALLHNADMPDRLMHHDTKINNVLLDTTTHQGLCVCDLDTLMPGKVISDLGDMVRTFVSPVSEETQDVEAMQVREPYYQALMEGYLSEMKHVLTPTEREHIFYSGPFLVYMQGLRFLSDYLQGDRYYPIQYPLHNYHRALTQARLLSDIFLKEARLRAIIATALR